MVFFYFVGEKIRYVSILYSNPKMLKTWVCLDKQFI